MVRARTLVAAASMLGWVAGSPKGTLGAQGLSSSSIEGAVVADDSTPVRGAVVTLRGTQTGTSRTFTTGAGGRFVFESVEIGSYRIDARAIGLLPVTIERLVLHLGDRLRLDLTLGRRLANALEPVAISVPALRDAGAGGPSVSIPREAIRSLPLLDRDFVGLFSVSSQAAGRDALWVSGQHSRFNGIQVDGAIGNDLFGTNVTAGSNAGAKSVSLEALEEIRILTAPFDVRLGGFSGGLINAVTRSGSNVFRGSVFSSYSRSELVGTDTAGSGVPTFDQIQYGASVGGPIIRDRLHYFAVAEAQSRATQFSGSSVDELETGVTRDVVARAARVFRDRFGFDPGGPDAPLLRQPNAHLFFKLSWHPSASHALELSHSLSRGTTEQLNRTLRASNMADGWQLSNSGSEVRSSAAIVRLRAVSVLGAVTNEAMLGFTSTDDDLGSRSRVPLFLVQDSPNNYLAAGSVKGAQGTETRKRVLELTDNMSWRLGAHLLTVGTQNVLLHVRDNFFLGSWGVWTFNSVEALENDQPSRYEVSLPGAAQSPLANFSAALVSAYAQDRWRPTRGLSFTAGLRIDAPFFEAPSRNAVLRASGQLGRIDTRDFPTGNATLSPRLGFAWRPLGGDRSMVRGGVGAFTGRPPLVWLTGAYSSTGQEQTTLICTRASGVPTPTSDINALPRTCETAGSRSRPAVNYFDPAFRFQRAIKMSLGFDHRFTRSWSGSLDLVRSWSRDNVTMSDVNLAERGVTTEGRTMYGEVGTDGVPRPTRLDSVQFGPVFRYGNIDSDRSTAISISAQRSSESGGSMQVGYTWSRAEDVMSLTGFISSVIHRSNPVDGTLARRNLRRSARDVPHTLSAIAILPVGSGATFSAFFRARSGTPYAFTVRGDANADGAVGNDLAYVPTDISDVSLANPDAYPALEALIARLPCLRTQRGSIVERNSCRNRPMASLDARIAKRFLLRGDRGLEISADVFNVANLVNRNWGLVRETTSREDVALLSLVGWDVAKNRPLYAIPLAGGGAAFPSIDRVSSDVSRWRMQIGARYDF